MRDDVGLRVVIIRLVVEGSLVLTPTVSMDATDVVDVVVVVEGAIVLTGDVRGALVAIA